MENRLKCVRDFWNTEACGTHFIRETPGTAQFFEKYRDFRAQTEWHIREWIPFAEAKGKKVLEIGCGNGADGILFAKAGANYTGVDLTETAVEATRKHFALLGLPGTFQTENAESLSFPDGSFDWVYSYGVLHHSPHPEKAFQEMDRVLKPGGRATVMLYHKNSFNYYIRILFYMRLRLLMKIFFGRKNQRVAKNIRGNQSAKIWDVHHQNFLEQGWSYLRARHFVHHCTDGPGCPYAYVFTKRDVQKLFSSFRSVRCWVFHFPLRKYPFGKWVPKALEAFLARRFGWYLCVSLEK